MNFKQSLFCIIESKKENYYETNCKYTSYKYLGSNFTFDVDFANAVKFIVETEKSLKYKR